MGRGSVMPSSGTVGGGIVGMGKGRLNVPEGRRSEREGPKSMEEGPARRRAVARETRAWCGPRIWVGRPRRGEVGELDSSSEEEEEDEGE